LGVWTRCDASGAVSMLVREQAPSALDDPSGRLRRSTTLRASHWGSGLDAMRQARCRCWFGSRWQRRGTTLRGAFGARRPFGPVIGVWTRCDASGAASMLVREQAPSALDDPSGCLRRSTTLRARYWGSGLDAMRQARCRCWFGSRRLRRSTTLRARHWRSGLDAMRQARCRCWFGSRWQRRGTGGSWPPRRVINPEGG